MKIKKLAALSACLLTLLAGAQTNLPFKNASLPLPERIDDLMSRLTVEEKVSLLQASSEAISRLGVDKYYHGNEGLHGVVKGGRYTVFPQAIALSATWNPDLILDVSTAISDEARAQWNFYNQGKDQLNPYSDLLTLWSPTINMARDPRWGRTPETYGEDPFLTRQIGLSFVKGLQGNDAKYLKVVATPKHFVANNEEQNRFSCNAVISERALREYYLPAFKTCVVEGNAQAIMSAYNAISGTPCSANHWLLNEVLRGEWGFAGYVVSDCGALTYLEKEHHFVDTRKLAAKAAIEAGLDLECGNDIYTRHLYPAYQDGLITEASINTAARRVLEARFKLGIFDPPENNPYTRISPDVIGSQKHQELALETARQSMVLLKNQNRILPLDARKIKKIAVLGFNADQVVFGDYSGLPAISPVSPLKGIQSKVGDQIEVQHIRWKTAERNLNLLQSGYLRNDHNDEHGLFAEYYDDKFLTGTPQTRIDQQVNFDPVNQPPDSYTNYRHKSMRWTGYIAPDVSGAYKIGVHSDDGIRLWLNNELVVDEWHNRGATTDQVDIEMQAGQQYAITLEYFDNGGDAICQLLWKVPDRSSDDIYADDRQAASESDFVIAVMGINKTLEKEGRDRVSLELPEDQVDYLKEIYAANTNLIVVMVAGSSLALNWMDETIPAIVDAWYPGESGGTAIADVLFGDYNPAGRLPVTFYRSLEDLPPMDDYEIYNGRTYLYFEGEPLYAFGHGLSYTSFEYSQLALTPASDRINVSMKVKNTGACAGDEVVQLYVKDVASSVQRPLKQLVGFERTALAIGESKTIEFEVPIEELMYWDEQRRDWHLESGTFEFMVGASSQDIRLKETCTAGFVVAPPVQPTGNSIRECVRKVIK